MDEQTKRWLEEIEVRAEKATPGPWLYDAMAGRIVDEGHSLVAKCTGRSGACIGRIRSDEIFIAHARADVPALCAKVREQDAEIAELTQALEELREHCNDAARERDTRD